MASEGKYEGFDITSLQGILKNAEKLVIEKLAGIKEKAQDKVDIGDLFDMQWMMNKFSQLSEMSSSVLAAAHGAIQAITRNVK